MNAYFCSNRVSTGPKRESMKLANKATKYVICVHWPKNWVAVQRNCRKYQP